ncbi:MAG: cadherin-like domain-containing protein [Planctomycetes bacterium]|nr:cadherin-like domain-containing protein [Planctomycetota bacterium]
MPDVDRHESSSASRAWNPPQTSPIDAVGFLPAPTPAITGSLSPELLDGLLESPFDDLAPQSSPETPVAGARPSALSGSSSRTATPPASTPAAPAGDVSGSAGAIEPLRLSAPAASAVPTASTSEGDVFSLSGEGESGGSGGCDSGGSGGNDAPYAQDDFYVAAYSSQMNVNAVDGVLANDSDPNCDTLTAVLDTNVGNGSLTLNSDGSFTYDPNPGFLGTDQFTYLADDGTDQSDPATVIIEVGRPITNLDVDSTNDGVYDPLTDDPDEMLSPGMYIPVNDDDDNQNEIPDLDAAEAPFPSDDDDLRLGYTSFSGVSGGYGGFYGEADLTGFELSFESSDPDVRLWDTPTKQYELTDAVFSVDDTGAWWNGLPFPGQIYIEGLAPGEATLSLVMENADSPRQEVHRDEVKITRVRGDVDVDSNNDDVIDPDNTAAGTDDRIEHSGARMGKFIDVNSNDDDQDGVPDYADGYNYDGQAGTADDDPTAGEQFTPIVFEIPAPVDLDVAVLQLDYSASDPGAETLPAPGHLRLWKVDGNQARTLAEYVPPGVYEPWQLGLSNTQRDVTFYLEAVNSSAALGDQRITLQVDPDGPSVSGGGGQAGFVHQDAVAVTALAAGMTAFRPQTEGPGYGAPFARTPVPNATEGNPGAGIRRNGDDDDNDGGENRDLLPTDTAIANENDLIEVEIAMPPLLGLGQQYVLIRSNANINVWTSANKETAGEHGAWLDNSDTDNEEVITCDEADNVCSFWVEWVSMDAAQDEANLLLVIRDPVIQVDNVVDQIRFYPFTSVVIAFGGRDENPATFENGAFQIARQLYQQGYDVHAYDESLVDNTERIPYKEVESAIEKRGVDKVSIFGHSYGGGAVHVLSEQLKSAPPTPPAGTWSLAFTAYIDAINHDGVLAEDDLPPGTAYHVNYYETAQFGLDGTSTDDPDPNNPIPEIHNVHVNETAWGAQLGHFTIDNDPTVQKRIRDGHHVNDGDPNHDGLTERVAR